MDPHLEHIVLSALLRQWHRANDDLFDRALQPPSLRLVDAGGFLGRWRRQERLIEVSVSFARERPWQEVVGVLLHEMAHQFVDEVLHATDETAHGTSFRQTCARLGIDGRAAGLPPSDGRDGNTDRLMDRVRKLLSLAQSPNQHEAESAMRAARRLMIEHNLEEVRSAREREFEFRCVGAVKRRFDAHEYAVGGILSAHFMVRTLWIPWFSVAEAREGWTLELCGTHANVEMADYVHSFLHRVSEDLWAQHRRNHGIPGDKPRRSFLAGVMNGFRGKLDTDRRAEPGLALERIEEDPQLKAFHRRRYPHIHSRSGSRRSQDEAFTHGQDAGRSVVLHRPVEQGASGGTRLLTAGGG